MFQGAVLNLFFIGVSIAAIVILGFVVYLSKRDSVTSKTFLFFALVTALYGWFNYISSIASSTETVLWFLRGTIFFALWHAFSLFQLFYVFPKEQVVFSRWYKMLLIPWVSFVSLLTLTPLVFSGLQEVAPRGQISTAEVGPAIPFFGITAAALVLFAIYLLVKRVLISTGVEKKQYMLILVGCLITFPLYIIFNLVLPAFFLMVQYAPFASVFSLPFVFFTAYAIIRHKFLNVKVISTEILIFILSIAVLFEVINAGDLPALLFRATVFIFVLSIGVALIRTVHREVEQREKLTVLTQELETAYAKLKEVDQAKTDFLSMASHQLRSPLTVVKLGIGALLDGTFGDLTDKRQNVALNKMLESAERLIGLINDYLNVSRIELGKMQYNFKAGDLCGLVQSIVEEYQPRAKAKQLSLTFSCSLTKIPQVVFDDEKMRHVITNFVDNAIKYTHEGSIQVMCDLVNNKKDMRFQVKDTGMGMSQEDMDLAFQKFRRAQGGNLRRRDGEPIEGSGLGLHVAKMFAEAHAGKVFVESPGRGRGSTFGFVMPISGPPQQPIVTKPQETKATPVAS